MVKVCLSNINSFCMIHSTRVTDGQTIAYSMLGTCYMLSHAKNWIKYMFLNCRT